MNKNTENMSHNKSPSKYNNNLNNLDYNSDYQNDINTGDNLKLSARNNLKNIKNKFNFDAQTPTNIMDNKTSYDMNDHFITNQNQHTNSK